MSDEGGVTPSEVMRDVTPPEVTPWVGKGALPTRLRISEGESPSTAKSILLLQGRTIGPLRR